ncbi:MAG: hypothetical protein LPH20_07115, partial [Shewanella sp.]|nr:hypothetical protein [Shewanella sp.]
LRPLGGTPCVAIKARLERAKFNHERSTDPSYYRIYVVQIIDSPAIKFLFLLAVCFVVTLLLYHLFIRPYKLVQFTFGVK